MSGHVTNIDELPELQDLEGPYQQGPHGPPGLQGPYRGPPMGPYGQPHGPQPYNSQRHTGYMQTDVDVDLNQGEKYQKFIRGNHRMMTQSGMEAYGPPPGPSGYEEAIMQGPPHPPQFHIPASSLNCVDINKHIQDCPICSKFYHNDKTVYIIAIIVLSIICLLLLKKVLNV